MIKYLICLNVPEIKHPHIIAEYSSDPNLQVNDKVNIIGLELNKISSDVDRDMKFKEEIKHSFEAEVTMRKKLMDVRNNEFKVQIDLELTDQEKLNKEKLFELTKAIKRKRSLGVNDIY